MTTSPDGICARTLAQSRTMARPKHRFFRTEATRSLSMARNSCPITRHTARDCVTIRNLFFGGWNGASLPAGHPYLCGLICVQPALPACPFGLNEGESVRMYSLVLPVVLAQAWLYWLDICTRCPVAGSE